MIDLDKAQHDAGWEPRFKVGGVIVRMAHPSAVKVADERRGLLPWVARFASRLWRLVVGGSETAALRKAVLECVDAFDGETARAVVCMSAWDLGRLYGAYQEAARGVLAKSVRGAFEGGNEAALNGASTGVHGGGTESTAMKLTSASTGWKPVPPGAEPPGAGELARVGLVAGGGKLPGVMGGGPLWGKAWVDANPEEAARRLEQRMENDRLALEKLRAGGRVNAQTNQPSEVSNGD